MIDHFARCRAVVFPPFNEDYGFVTVEAFMCGKPVITCTDSGGPAELVRDGENGYVTDPTPEALSVAMLKLTDDRNLAQRLGEAGQAMATQMTWSKAIQQLLR
jgi:glycosyltransferase involved in cell wall biosynthesis